MPTSVGKAEECCGKEELTANKMRNRYFKINNIKINHGIYVSASKGNLRYYKMV